MMTTLLIWGDTGIISPGFENIREVTFYHLPTPPGLEKEHIPLGFFQIDMKP